MEQPKKRYKSAKPERSLDLVGGFNLSQIYQSYISQIGSSDHLLGRGKHQKKFEITTVSEFFGTLTLTLRPSVKKVARNLRGDLEGMFQLGTPPKK